MQRYFNSARTSPSNGRECEKPFPSRPSGALAQQHAQIFGAQAPALAAALPWWLTEFALGVLAGYLLVTLAESYLHEHIHHARRYFRLLQKRYPRALGAFREAYRSHTIIHHGHTYRDHVTQFTSAAQKNSVDAMLSDRAGQRIISERYGATLNLRSTLLFVCPILPVVIPLLLVLPLPAKAGFLVPVIIYPLMSKWIHPYLHMRYADAIQQAPRHLKWVLRTPYMQGVWRNHWMHHRYPRFNFNLILGGDWLRGVYRSPSERDLRRMRESGIPVNRSCCDSARASGPPSRIPIRLGGGGSDFTSPSQED
jgi:hypothetical protein